MVRDWLAWEAVSTTYIFLFFGVVAGLIGIFVLGSAFLSWNSRRRVEREITEIETRSGLNNDEADFVVHISNKNHLNVPTSLYTSLRVFDTLVGREIELLLDSAAPLQVKRSTLALARGARAKLFPWTIKVAPGDAALTTLEAEIPFRQE